MIGLFLKSVLAVVLCCLAISCSHEDVSTPDAGANEIAYVVSNKATRGFIDNANLNTIGTTMSVYGFCDDVPLHSGTSMAMQNANLKYDIVNSEPRWAIMNGNTPVKYYWSKEGGRYKFFGWLKHDAASALHTPSEWTYDEASKMLTVPEWTLDKNYSQLDFIYSDVMSGIWTSRMRTNWAACQCLLQCIISFHLLVWA